MGVSSLKFVLLVEDRTHLRAQVKLLAKYRESTRMGSRFKFRSVQMF